MADAPILTVAFEGFDAFVAQEPHLARGCFFLPAVDPAPEPFVELLVVIETPAAAPLQLPARVVQITPGRAMAISFVDVAGARAKLLPLFNDARVATEHKSGGVRVAWGRASAISTADAASSDSACSADGAGEEKAAGPIYDQIQAMSTKDRMDLALHGDRTARQILLKDKIKTIQVFVLKNPRITLDEVRYMAGYRQAGPDVLTAIANHVDWSQNQGIVTALVRNPKTPPMLAVRLLDRLPVAEIRRLAKSSDVARAVTLAARKKLEA